MTNIRVCVCVDEELISRAKKYEINVSKAARQGIADRIEYERKVAEMFGKPLPE